MTAWLLITIAALGAVAWAPCFATLLAVAAIEAHWRARNRWPAKTCARSIFGTRIRHRCSRPTNPPINQRT